MVYHRVFLYSVVYMYVQTYIHRHPSVSSGKGSRALPPPPTAPYRSDSTVQKTSKQTRHRHAAARKCVFFPLTLSVFAVVLCGVRRHTTPAHLPLRPVLKSDPPTSPHPNVTCLMKDGRSSLLVEKKREAMSCVETEI